MSPALDLLALLNGLAVRVKPRGIRAAASLEEKLADTGLDSLDIVLISVYVCEVYGIPEAVGKTLHPSTFADVAAFITAHMQREPATLEEAFAVVDGT